MFEWSLRRKLETGNLGFGVLMVSLEEEEDEGRVGENGAERGQKQRSGERGRSAALVGARLT